MRPAGFFAGVVGFLRRCAGRCCPCEPQIAERIISIQEGLRKGEEEVEYWVLRAKAIQTYANLEQGLCMVFSYVGDIPNESAGIVFFKISSSQARNAILDKLQRKKFWGKYNIFWNSLLEQLRPISASQQSTGASR